MLFAPLILQGLKSNGQLNYFNFPCLILLAGLQVIPENYPREWPLKSVCDLLFVTSVKQGGYEICE